MDTSLTTDELSRFNFYIAKRGEDECWEWLGYKLKSGHGQFKLRGKAVYAYRVAYFIKDPTFDQSLCVLHKCDNGSCVNPNHLFLGTLSDNDNDRHKKGRTAVGTAVGGLLLESDVIEIKKLSEGGISQASIASRFRVDRSLISRILSGHRWGHLNTETGMNPATK